ncbi:MAG: hypothetical protein FWE21_08165 [Defluviitaleaceae bacterium]|nr:hypothetical protein [Defluviitaleaceae bacterium]
MAQRDFHEFDFVYLNEKEEFKTLHVVLTVADDAKPRLRLEIHADEDVDDEALRHIVLEMESTRLKSMRLNLAEDCAVILRVSGCNGRQVDMKGEANAQT